VNANGLDFVLNAFALILNPQQGALRQLGPRGDAVGSVEVCLFVLKLKRMCMRAPSFAGLKPASASASLVKRMNRCVETKHEVLLRRELWRRGLRFRKNRTDLPGKPDVVFASARVAVFCDGDFWHGRNWRRLSLQLRKRANPEYWCQKIRSNRARDRRITALLERLGWLVIRLWEKDIHASPQNAVAVVERAVLARLQDKQCAS
jgi:DNA mismatch endonuclease, patch repair protein